MRRGRRLRPSWLAALACAGLASKVALVPSVAQAQTGAERTSVQILLCAPQDELQPLERALRDVTETFRVSAAVQPATCTSQPDIVRNGPRPSDALARIFIDLRGSVAKLYIVDEKNGNILVRDVPRKGVSLQVVHEQLAEIVRASLDTLLEGGSVGVRPANAGATATQVPRLETGRERRRDELALGLGLYYAAVSYASGAPVLHGPGILVEARQASRRLAWALGASAEYRFVDRNEPSVRLHLDLLPLRLLVGLSFPLGSGRLQLGLGAGADLTRVAPRPAELSDDVADARWLGTTVFRAQARLTARVSERFGLFSLVALDADPSATRYVVTLDGQERAILSPWRVRPGVGLGVSL